jgi:hypothetical protein
MGDITVSAESDTDRTGADTSSITVSYAMSDGMTISLENSEDVNEVSVSYASGAISVGLTADDAATESWEATMAYDLGGGATFNLGTNQDETTFAGVGFSF